MSLIVISEASLNTRYGTGSVVKTAIRNVACNLAKPASNLLTYYYRADYSLRFVREFRTSELTSNVPYAVRSTFRNERAGYFSGH